VTSCPGLLSSELTGEGSSFGTAPSRNRLSSLALYLTEEDIDSLLTPADAVPTIEACFQRLAEGVIENRPRTRTRLAEGVFAVMSAVDSELGLAGLKSYLWLPGGTPFLVVLFDVEKAQLAAVIEADKLGQLRTGAASGVAAKYLAKPDARTLGVIGCGWQAESQVACIREALPGIERVVAYCRTEKSLRAFCKKVGAEPGESHRDPAQLDIVVTVTTSRDPVLRGEWLQPGALVCAVGANDARQRELDNVVLERAVFVCCDSVEDARVESGDLIEPVERGVLDWLEVHELQEVVAGEVAGRSSPEDIVVFKSNGIAAWDVAIGAVALARAREQNVGKEV
jgi:ornithine cyclodeaminase/alanine dehydrogenase-like protein (mu-crystallin family)